MGLMKLLKRAFLGKKAFKENEEIKEKIKNMKRKQESEVAKKGILAAHNENMKISAKTRKIQKECWKLIKEIEEKYPQIYNYN